MIESVTVTNSKGETLVIPLADPLASGFAISGITGVGPVAANVSTTSYASRDGAVFNSARVDIRNIVIGMIFMETSSDSTEDIRHRSYRYFPIKDKVTLKFKTANRECSIEGYVESNEPEIFSQRESTQISIICPDPYFYDNSTKQKISFFAKVGAFSFPFANEGTDKKTIIMGKITKQFTKSFNYDGEGRTGIVIILDFIGAVTGKITIANNTTGQKMIIDTSLFAGGYRIKSADRLIIDTNPGNKYVRFGKSVNGNAPTSVVNILNCVAVGSEWIEIVHGENNFTISADEGQENIEASVRSVIKYEGI